MVGGVVEAEEPPPDLVAFLRPLLLRDAEDCGLEEAEFDLEVQRLLGRSDL